MQIEGANGSGKTTLLRLLTRALEASSGAVLYGGVNIEQCLYEYREQILYLGHQPGVKLNLSAEENLRWMSPVSTAPEAIASALADLGLRGYEDVPCYSLSAGQHRRVALARLLTSQARIWLLDEPFTAIDKQGVAFLEQSMQKHLDQGGAILVSTHQDLAIAGVRKILVQPSVDLGAD